MSLDNTHDIGNVKIVMVGAGGSGASSLSDLSDTNISNPSNGQLLGYNGTSGKWENVTGGGGGGDSFAGLGIGKKTGVSSNVIDTDIDLHRSPMVGDRLLVYFDEKVTNPTGIITYNNGTAVTSNLENAVSLYINAGWNILEFKNDGLLYDNCWVRVQNVAIPNNTLYGLSDTTILNPTDGQVLTFDDNKWKNMALPTVAANTGTARAELKKIQIGNVVYNADSIKHYDVSSISNGAINVSVPNAGHLDGEIIAVNTGANSGTTSSAWSLRLSDGQTIEALTMSKGGSAYTDAITANCLLFVKCDVTNSSAVLLGIAGAGTDVEANVGFSDTELKKIKVGDIVYDTDGLRDYSVSSIANNNITVSVLNAEQFVMENIAINTGAHSGSSSAWNLVLDDGTNTKTVALKNADGTAFSDDISENELLFVYVDTAGNVARVLDIPVNTTEIKTVSGNPITLTDAIAGNAIEVSAEIVASQSGSGTPSPTNIRPISGFSSVTITREDAQGQTATVTVALGQTVYGGTLDLTSGELTIDTVTKSFDGTESINLVADANRRFVYLLEPASSTDEDVTISKGMVSHGELQNNWSGSFGHFRINASSYLGILDNSSQFATVDALKSWLATQNTGGTPLQICYPLATPTTTTLTAAQLALVKGYNQLSCNSGDMEITYKASGLDALKERVDELEDAVEDIETDLASKTEKTTIGTVESGTTASQPYAVGEHFIRNDKFCTAIAAIASGATLTLNTNYVEGTIAEAVTNKYNYSTTEHVVGKWIDGSNIYEITADQGTEIAIPTITGGGWGNSNISNANVKAILSAWGVSNSGTLWGLNANRDTGNYCQFCLARDGGGTSGVRYITIQYLKKS